MGGDSLRMAGERARQAYGRPTRATPDTPVGAEEYVQQVEAERRRLSSIISSLPDAIVHVDAASGVVEANEAARQMFGWDAGGAPESFWNGGGLYRTEDGRPIPANEGPVSRALRGERVIGEEIWVEKAGGALLPVLCSAAPVCDEKGAITSAVAEFQDVSRVRCAQERIAALARERADLLDAVALQLQSLRALLDSAPVGMMMVQGRQGRTVSFNPEMSQIAGMTPAEGQDLASYAPDIVLRRADGSACPIEERPLERALTRGETTRAEEMLLERPDGTVVPVLLHAVPIFGPEGEITGAVGVAEDRTHLLELQRQRTEFVSMLSHEMKNPLTVIKGVASTVRRRRDALPREEVTELLELLEQQSDRLTDLLDNLLNISRLESGTFSIEAGPLCLRKMLDDVCLEFAAGTPTHAIRAEIAPDLPIVLADESRIEQVVLNLLTNAAKFSPAGTLILVRGEREGERIRVSVQDEGSGIDRDDLPRLFEKFSRLHSHAKPGNGLGLAISRGIVEAHGGSIWAESAGRGSGSTFSFTLPV